MWKLTFIVAFLDAAFGASLYHCHDGTNCQLPGHVDATSFEFLGKFTQKQYRTVISLTMSNASVNKIDPKLKYLKNLQYLDLSHNSVQTSSIPSLTNLKTLKLNGNNLKYINLTGLPQNIETLDISHNLLVHIPKDWKSLKALKTLHLYKNLIDCDCNNVLNYDRLVKSGIVVPETVTCHSPKKYAGKDISAVNCSLDDIMLYDEPDVGSGDIFEDATETILSVPLVQEHEDEVVQDSNTFIDDKVPESDLLPAGTTESTAEEIEEGSGDEGSGYIAMGDDLGCLQNCSTPGPVGANDGENDSPLPSVIDQAKLLINDIMDPFRGETTSTSTTTTTTTTTTATPVVTEPKIVKVEHRKVGETPKETEDVEVIEHNTKTGELERAQMTPKNSTAVYAIIGVGLFLAVVFTVCFVKKRRAKRKNSKRREIPSLIGEEMKPLSKPNQNSNDKQIKNASNIPEHVPLINGQNGKPKDDTPTLTSFTPLAHPETLREEEPEHDNLQNNEDDVEIREKPVPELLTPQRERVTIKETEIPDSIPKTPLLVHRQRNSDGEIVTTLVP